MFWIIICIIVGLLLMGFSLFFCLIHHISKACEEAQRDGLENPFL